MVGSARRTARRTARSSRANVGAFWTLAPATVASAGLAGLAYGAALVFGAAVGALRLAFGAHFFSDIVFAGVFTFLLIWTGARPALSLAETGVR